MVLQLVVFVALAELGWSQDSLNRTVLPIPEPKPPVITELDARNAKAPPPFKVTAPKGAPNVVIVLLDDMGFGQSSAFGGPIHMPTLDMLAAQGLRYNNFHTTALCSPTRNALLTGRNHHVANAGAITELATAFPGNTGVRPLMEQSVIVNEVIVDVFKQFIIPIRPHQVVASLVQVRIPPRLVSEALQTFSNFVSSRFVHDLVS